MPHPLLIFNQSGYLILIIAINLHTWWQTVQIQISWLLQKPTDLNLHCLQNRVYPGSAGQGLNFSNLWAKTEDNKLMYLFFRKYGLKFHVICLLICLRCQTRFSCKKYKIISKCLLGILPTKQSVKAQMQNPYIFYVSHQPLWVILCCLREREKCDRRESREKREKIKEN